MLGDEPRARTRVYQDYAIGDALDRADLLVTYTCNTRPDPSQQRQLVEFVERGGRWLALHGSNSAIDAPKPGGPRIYSTPRELGPVAQVLGSQFLGHPPIAPYLVEVAQADHPLVAGVETFEVTDELYISELHPPLDILLHTRFSGSSRGFAEGDTVDDQPRPVLYLKRTGAGEVCYFTLGHCRGRYDMQDVGVDDLGVQDRGGWVIPEFVTILKRCLAWGLYGYPAAASALITAV